VKQEPLDEDDPKHENEQYCTPDQYISPLAQRYGSEMRGTRSSGVHELTDTLSAYTLNSQLNNDGYQPNRGLSELILESSGLSDNEQPLMTNADPLLGHHHQQQMSPTDQWNVTSFSPQSTNTNTSMDMS